MRRRQFLSTLAAAAAPALTRPVFAQGRPNGPLTIKDIELWRLSGETTGPVGANRQYQVQPQHIYDNLRPKPYHEAANPKTGVSKQSAIYLKIVTDQGLEGLYGPVDREAAVVVDLQLKPFLIGKDPLAGEILWDQLFRLNRHSRAGHFMIGISAVDNAVWDLRGRYYQAPVYRLLGGPGRTQLDAYGSCLGYSVEPDAVRRQSAALKQEGFHYQKWFLAYGPGSGFEGLKKNVELVAVLRETLGDDVDIMFDAFQGWDLRYATEWAQRVEPYRPRWIEEAFPMEQMESFVQLRRATSVPVATGEHFYNRWEVSRFLEAQAITVVQADPEWCGGVSELVKICHVASLHDAQVIPHGHSLHAAMHVVASQPPNTCPLVENLILKMNSYYHFEKNPPHVTAGKIHLPDRPGFGIELDEAKVLKREPVRFG